MKKITIFFTLLCLITVHKEILSSESAPWDSEGYKATPRYLDHPVTEEREEPSHEEDEPSDKVYSPSPYDYDYDDIYRF